MRYPVSKTGGPSGLGGSTPSSFRLPRRAMAEAGKAARCYPVGGSVRAARRFESCCLRLIRSGVVELERRAVVTRENAGSSPCRRSLVSPAAASGRAELGSRRRRPETRGTRLAPVVDVAMTRALNPEAAVRVPSGGTRRSTSGRGGAWPPRRFGSRRSQVRLLPARSVRYRRAVEERLSSRAS